MKSKIKDALLAALRFAPLIVCTVFMCVYLFSGKEVTTESLLNFAPEEPLYAALFLVLLYAFKSLTVVFPITVLNVLGGFLFEPDHALIVNAVGVLVELTVPYWIGRAYGADLINKLFTNHPKLAEIINDGSGSDFFISFFLRVIACLPGDAISMYFGARKLPFWTCLLGSFLGTFPSMAAATLLGMNITDPTSPMFWTSVGLTVGLSAISFLVYFLWRKARRKQI